MTVKNRTIITRIYDMIVDMVIAGGEAIRMTMAAMAIISYVKYIINRDPRTYLANKKPR